MPQWEIKVMGRVQGVGFRYYVQSSARRCGLNGYVRNLPDRSVYIIAQGREELIDSFCEYLRLGNGFSRVDGLIMEKIDTAKEYNDFQIR